MSQVNYMQPLQNIINEYRSKSPTELESLIGKDNHFEFSENDKNYQIEVNLLWDDQAKKVIRMDIFTDYLKKRKWCHFGDRPVYSMLKNSTDSIDEWVDPRLNVKGKF